MPRSERQQLCDVREQEPAATSELAKRRARVTVEAEGMPCAILSYRHCAVPCSDGQMLRASVSSGTSAPPHPPHPPPRAAAHQRPSDQPQPPALPLADTQSSLPRIAPSQPGKGGGSGQEGVPATAREQVPDLVWSQTWQDVLVPKRDGLTQRGFCLKQDGGCLGPFFERGRSI